MKLKTLLSLNRADVVNLVKHFWLEEKNLTVVVAEKLTSKRIVREIINFKEETIKKYLN